MTFALPSLVAQKYIDEVHNIPKSAFISQIIDCKLVYGIERSWYTDIKTTPTHPGVLHMDKNNVWLTYEFDTLAAYMHLEFTSGHIWAYVASTSEQAATTHLSVLEQHFVERLKEEDGMLSMTFWNMGSHGPKSLERRLASHKWPDIKHNYTESVRQELEALVNLEGFTEDKGKLMLFHGNPGTGKTHVIRALIEAWKPWATAEYIIDPESFFNDASYMMNVIMKDGDQSSLDIFDYLDDNSDEVSLKAKQQKWRLLICEDTGELLSKDASSRSGQGLSRCLNLVDGFIGQGLRVLLLITTNEKLGSLHEAVSRQGRTYATIQFKDLSPEEASTWLGSEVRSYTSLAELYALKNEHDNNSHKNSGESRRVGFMMP